MEKTLRNKIRSEYVKGIPRETRQTRDMTILFKKRFRLSVRKTRFRTEVANWNLLSANCVSCLIGSCKGLSVVIVAIIRRKLVLTHASIVFGGMLASVKSVWSIGLLRLKRFMRTIMGCHARQNGGTPAMKY